MKFKNLKKHESLMDKVWYTTNGGKYGHDFLEIQIREVNIAGTNQRSVSTKNKLYYFSITDGFKYIVSISKYSKGLENTFNAAMEYINTKLV